MRKRLIEKFTKAKEGSFGYTMTELLVVVAIIAIVAAIAIPSVIAISRALKFKRVNDHAKSIFLAAQQNLTEMRSDGGLKPLQSAEGAGMIPAAATGFPDEFRSEYVYTTTGTAAFELLLPAGSVEATVRSEDIVIEYNPITGNVYAVFYCEDDDQNIMSAYAGTDLPREDKSARKDMMLGYYDGSGLNSSQLELEEVRATVEFVNGEEGIVRVLVPVPDDFFGNLDEYAKAMTINLSVTGEYSMVQAAAGAAEGESGETAQTPGYVFSVPIKVAGPGLGENCYVEYGNTIVVEYPIDSLVNYGSFANYSSSTYDGAKNAGGTDAKAHLTDLMDETRFTVLPGENVTLEAEVKVDSEIRVEVENGILSGVNPMFEYLQPSGTGGYVLAVSNGRNLQNLNAIAPTIAKQVDSVVFTSDIYWNDTVSYYNDKYGNGSGSYANAAAENPARALPYFVPIHHEDLFGTARFIFPGDESDGGLGSIIQGILNSIFGGYSNKVVPTLTDEVDNVPDEETGIIPAETHANIQGNGHKVYNLNIDSTKYAVPNEGKFYATGGNQLIDYYFSGLFGYVNTPIDNLHVVNPIVKGRDFDDKETTVLGYGSWLDVILGRPRPIKAYVYGNPATGALLGAGGFNTLVTNCSTYIDKDARGYIDAYLYHGGYSKDVDQKWYGVSGEGAVGGLVGYAKSHRSVTGELTDDKAHLAFSKCFAAVPVTGNMRSTSNKHYGYSNGVGAFIGNSQLTNFYNCYASGNVIAQNVLVTEFAGNYIQQGIFNIASKLFGSDIKMQLLNNGRKSWGAGGFVGTSHGTRYTNCFATGDVDASAIGNKGGAGGFVGFMSIDETFKYGNEAEDNFDDDTIAQRTVFTNCYSVGRAVTNTAIYENFSGANGRIAFSSSQFGANLLGDYYRLYAPYYVGNGGEEPEFEGQYIYRDTYFMSGYTEDANIQSGTCAEPEPYSTFENLVGNHEKNTSWTDSQIKAIKDIVLYTTTEGNRWDGYETVYHTYETEYFNQVKNDGLTTIYRDLYDEGYSANEWNKATASTTHPYSMPNGSVYPFTKLAGLEYYGDWPSKPSAMGLAYYDAYATDPEKNQFFFDREHDDNASLHLNDGENVMVVEDGYAIFSANNAALTVTVNGVTDTLAASSERYTVSNNTYHVFYLSDKLMKALPANGEFYCTVTAKHTGGDTYTMYFNPGVAISHVNPTDGKTAATKPDAAPKTIYVRSARQFKAIAALEDFWGKGYSYIQQLNIDAVKYSWEDAERKVSSIGNAQKPFQASYSAGYTVEGDIAKQYKLSGFLFADNAAGFFGTIGKDGSIENLIVECDAVSVGGTSVSDVAVLAGRNEGTISNVDMVLKNLTTLTAADNAGLLAGYSSGTVRDCEVSAAAVTVNAKNGGGLIGSAEGTANAKAKVSGCKLTLTGDLTVSGTGNAGGLIGQAKHLNLTATEPLVTMTKLTAANAAYAGGLAGWMEDSEIKITDAASVTTVTFNTVSAAKGTAAGFLGGGKNVAANGVDVTAGTVSGNIAAGFLGTGTNVDAAYCDVVITNGIQGKAKAAGVAGTIGAQSVFEYVTVEYVTVNLGTKVEATEGNAAGYAVELAAETDVMNGSVTLNNTTISAPKGKAAGYACSAAGYVGSSNGSSVPSSVVRKDGKNTISGANAAGFACEITGQVSGAFVTPALDSSKYLGNNNENLVVNGTSSAAGFALTVGENATVTNCYALDKITGGSVTGFVGTNKGTITGCMANVTISGGNAFVATNDGTVTRCYGWYGDGNETNATTTKAEVGGKCFSAYFADLNPVDKEGDIVTLYAADGTVQTMSATALQGAAEILANASNKWYTTGYNSYPYTQKPSAMPNYLYPMLRDHFGDWITPPQYAYGVAYYETYEVTASAAEPADAADTAEAAETPAPTTTTVVKLHIVDLSDSTVTEEKQAISTYLVDQAGKVTTSATTVFNNEYTIKTSGYAVFGKKGANVLASMNGSETPLFTYTLSNNKDAKNITYEFFPLKTDSAKDGVVTIGATAVSSTGATVQTWFADAINPGNTYEVRTPEQLAKIGAVAANFSQTHDIAVTDFTTVEKLSGNYAGNGLKLSVSGQTKTWLNEAAGKVENLKLVVSGGVNAPVFGTVSGTVTLSGLTVDTIGEKGSLAETVSGTVNIPAVKTAAVAGKLFGEVSGTVTTKDIEVTGKVNQLFGAVKNVTVDGAITVGGNATTQLFGDVSGTVSTKAISVTGTAAKVFSNVSGTGVTVDGTITTGGTSQIFGTVGAPVTVNGLIKTGDLTGNAIGSVSANMTLNGITVGNIPAEKYVIAGITGGTVSTGAVTVNNVSGQVFGEIKGGTVTVGAVSTQAVGTAAVDGADAKLTNIFGNVTGGSVTVASINTNGNAVNGNVFGTVGGSGVTVSGPITTGVVTGNVFGDATAAIKTGDITVNGNAGNVFCGVAGAQTGKIEVKGEAAQVFGAVSGNVTTGAITTGNVTGNVFGAVTAKVTANGITAGTVGNVVASAGANSDVSTGAIVITSGQIIGPVSGGKVETGTITVDSVTANSILAKVEGGTVTLGDITINPVVTKDEAGNEITTYADVPTLIGEVKVGTVSGANVNLVSANIPGGIFASVASGTVQNFNVTTTGAMSAPLVGGDLGGNLTNLTVECGSATVEGGILVKSVGQKAAVSGCTVKVTGEAKIGGSNAGGLTGSNAGTLSGNTVNIGTLTATGTNATVGGLVGTNGGTISGTTNVTVTTLSGGKTVGGLAGTNSGSISGAEVSATINHTGNGGVTIGGIVGEMTGGSLMKSKASGSINAPENLTNKANAIGGAIGKISAGTVGENNENTPTVVTTSVTVDPKWAGSAVTVEGVQFQNTGNGSVGTFVGSIVNGAFTSCSSTAKSSYQFMGQIAVKSNTLDSNKSIWFSNAAGNADTSAVADYVEGQPADYSGKGYTRLDGGYAYNTYDATLSNCTFVYSDENTYNQEIGVDDYFYLGSESKIEIYSANRVNSSKITYTPVEYVRYTNIAQYTNSGDGTQTDIPTTYYYMDGNEYKQVYADVTRTSENGWLGTSYKYTYKLKYTGASGYFHEKTNVSDSSYYTEKKLYSINGDFPSLGNDVMYMIVNKAGNKALDVNGSAVDFNAEFEKNTNLYNAIWKSNGTGNAWQNVSNTAKYINIARDQVVSGSANTTVEFGSADATGYALYKVTNNGYYLAYNRGFTTVEDDWAWLAEHVFKIYKVTSSTSWEASFALQKNLYSEQILPVLPAATALSEETEIPADNGGETGNNT